MSVHKLPVLTIKYATMSSQLCLFRAN